jgi:2-polyprenyl-6-methoxyphenol hydroxylase-like FAD-dependent oxidoreductase
MDIFDTDVLVVGAGPTGLMAASELTRHGVACRIIDKNAHGVRNSRALTLHARSLELLQILGLAGKLVRRGYPSPGINISVDISNPAVVEMYTVDTRYPYVLILSQAVTEEVLEEHLNALGVSVQRLTTLTDLEQDAAMVTARVRDEEGREKVIRARYLIDCGGAGSLALRQLDIPWTGGMISGIAMLADVKFTGELTKGFITNYATDRGVCLFLPFPDEYIRVIALDFTKQDVAHDAPLDLADLQESVDAIVPMSVRLHDPRWLTHFRAPHRVVDRYRSGRVFLAGDAAHLFIPAGGQGMNTGLQDSFNLAWKMAAVLAGRAGDDLLDSYHTERREIGRQTLRVADTQFRIFLNQARHRSVRKIAPTLIRRLLRVQGVQRRVSQTLSQVGIHYGHTDLSRRQHDASLPSHAVQAGDRLPDAEVTSATEPDTPLYDLLRHGGFTLLGYVSPLRPAAERDQVTAFLRDVQMRAGDALRSCLVLEEGLAQNGDLPVVVDVKRHVRTKLGATPGSVILVRPDAYVAFHTCLSAQTGADRQRCDALLDAWLPRADAPLLPRLTTEGVGV